jgi:hypothetical protein
VGLGQAEAGVFGGAHELAVVVVGICGPHAIERDLGRQEAGFIVFKAPSLPPWVPDLGQEPAGRVFELGSVTVGRNHRRQIAVPIALNLELAAVAVGDFAQPLVVVVVEGRGLLAVVGVERPSVEAILVELVEDPALD